jgi:hypothetical protein
MAGSSGIVDDIDEVDCCGIRMSGSIARRNKSIGACREFVQRQAGQFWPGWSMAGRWR